MHSNLSEELITFKQKDPSLIGSGLHDYEVYYDNCFTGILTFRQPSDVLNNAALNFASFISNNVVYSTGLRLEDIVEMKSNDEILNSVKPTILYIMQHGKIFNMERGN